MKIFSKSKKILSFLFCLISLVLIICSCKSTEKKTLTIGVDAEVYNNFIQLENGLNYALNVNGSDYSVKLKTIDQDAFESSIEKCDVVFLNEQLDYAVENNLLEPYEGYLSSKENKDIRSIYINEDSFLIGNRNGKQYFLPVGDNAIYHLDSCSFNWTININVCDNADIPFEEYCTEFTESDQLLTRIKENYGVPIIQIPKRTENHPFLDYPSSMPWGIAETLGRYDIVASGIGFTKEEPVKAVNLFEEDYFYEYVKAMIRYRENGLTSSSVLDKKIMNMIGSDSAFTVNKYSPYYTFPDIENKYVYIKPYNYYGAAITSASSQKDLGAEFLYSISCDSEIRSVFNTNSCYNYIYRYNEFEDFTKNYLETLKIAKPSYYYFDYDVKEIIDILKKMSSYIDNNCCDFFYEGGILSDENGKISDESIKNGLEKISQDLKKLGLDKALDFFNKYIKTVRNQS